MFGLRQSLRLSDRWQETAGDRATSWKEWPAIKLAISTTEMGASQNTYVCLIHEHKVALDNKVSTQQTLKWTAGYIFVWVPLCDYISNCYCSWKQNFCSKLALKRHHKTVPPSFIASPRLLPPSPRCDFTSNAEESVSERSVWFSAI